MKQMTVRLDDETHKEVKHLLVEIDKSFNDYVIELIKNDLSIKKNKE